MIILVIYKLGNFSSGLNDPNYPDICKEKLIVEVFCHLQEGKVAKVDATSLFFFYFNFLT